MWETTPEVLVRMEIEVERSNRFPGEEYQGPSNSFSPLTIKGVPEMTSRRKRFRSEERWAGPAGLGPFMVKQPLPRDDLNSSANELCLSNTRHRVDTTKCFSWKFCPLHTQWAWFS